MTIELGSERLRGLHAALARQVAQEEGHDARSEDTPVRCGLVWWRKGHARKRRTVGKRKEPLIAKVPPPKTMREIERRRRKQILGMLAASVPIEVVALRLGVRPATVKKLIELEEGIEMSDKSVNVEALTYDDYLRALGLEAEATQYVNLSEDADEYQTFVDELGPEAVAKRARQYTEQLQRDREEIAKANERHREAVMERGGWEERLRRIRLGWHKRR